MGRNSWFSWENGTVWLNRLTGALTPIWSLRWDLRGEFEHGLPPPGSPALFAANHSCFLDPWFMVFTIPRGIRFLITRKWYDKSSFWRGFFRANGTIPVDDGDYESTFARILRALADGDCVGIFPEGRISRDGKLQRLRSGIGVIAARTGVPVYPIGIRGAYEVLPRTRRWPKAGAIRICIGPPLFFPQSPRAEVPSRPELGAFRDRLADEIARLSGQAPPLTRAVPIREVEAPSLEKEPALV